jgi:hypothetical protein
MYKFCYFLLLFFSTKCFSENALAINEPKITGAYGRTDNICETRQGNVVIKCASADSKMVIKKQKEGFTVESTFYGPNWHQCEFKGSYGYWQFDRLIINSEAAPQCQLTLFFFNNAVHTVASQECNVTCGARTPLDGQILKKMANPSFKRDLLKQAP